MLGRIWRQNDFSRSAHAASCYRLMCMPAADNATRAAGMQRKAEIIMNNRELILEVRKD